MIPIMLGAAALVAAAAAADTAAADTAVKLQAIPFALSSVRLQPGSRLHSQLSANTDWLMNLDVASLACLYTSAANLTCSTQQWPYKCIAGPQQPACTPYHHQAYFGHYLGHYLSATAMAFEATGNPAVKSRGDEVVALLSKVQHAFGEKVWLWLSWLRLWLSSLWRQRR